MRDPFLHYTIYFLILKTSVSDPLLPNVDPRIRIHYYGKVDPKIRIRIHVKMRWIRNAAKNIGGFRNVCTYRIKDKNKKGNTLVGAELISVIYLAI